MMQNYNFLPTKLSSSRNILCHKPVKSCNNGPSPTIERHFATKMRQITCHASLPLLAGHKHIIRVTPDATFFVVKGELSTTAQGEELELFI
ncbi:MAG: hypothetical protein IJ160_03660 [Muribaculaceae bacterium]|nr:hypothetical protein [Muribaculaceae bacterium]